MSRDSLTPSSSQPLIRKSLSRRAFVQVGGSMALGSLVAGMTAHPAHAAVFGGGMNESGARRIAFRNTHTGESFSGVYRVGDKYLPEAFDRINVVLRDFRSSDIFPMDPRVIDIIHAVHNMTGRNDSYEILSGYRCPKTNAMLRANSSGVAKNSLHMTGQAVDLRLPGYTTSRIRDLAKSLKAGGVGYYSSSDFVHMDSGAVRSW